MQSIKRQVKIVDPIFENKWFYVVLLPLAALFVLFYSYTTSPFYVNEGMDSCIFKSMGLALLQGKTPYVDFFDHKGPILYFINACGQWLIPGRLGVFLLQIIAETIVFVFFYKTIRLFLNGTLSFIVLLATLCIYGGLYEEGNQCEEWMLVGIAPCFYFTCNILLRKGWRKLTDCYGLIMGVLFGWTFFIRPNDAVSLIGGCMFGMFLYEIFLHEKKNAIKNALYFVISFSCITIPILVFFASRDALSDLYFGMIQYNSAYAGGIGNMLRSCTEPTKMTFFLLVVTMCLLAYNSDKKVVLWALIPVTILAWILTGSKFFPHYLISFVPLFMLFFVFLASQKRLTTILMALCVLYCSSHASPIPYLFRAQNELYWRYASLLHPQTANQIGEYNSFYKETEALLDRVPIQEQDSIWNYNLAWRTNEFSYFSLFWHHQIVQCNRVPYYPMNMANPEFREMESIERKKPLWIMLTHNYDKYDSEYEYWKEEYPYIHTNYVLVERTDASICDIELYRRIIL